MDYDELLIPKREKEQPSRIPLKLPLRETPKKRKEEEEEGKRVIIIDI